MRGSIGFSVALCILVVTTVGCASTSSGPEIKQDKVGQIQKGVTTRAELVQLLGPPMSESMSGDGGRLLLYLANQGHMNVTSTAVPFVNLFAGQSSTMRTQQLQVMLDSNNVVKDYVFSDNTTETNQSGLLGGNHVESKTTANTP